MPDSETWKVLLIDDEEGIRRVMTITLEDAGYSVVAAPDGETGIRLCNDLSPQIVITDIRMPGMNGIAVLEEIKRLDPDIEVIVVTAFGEMELAIRALQLDASDFITKPVNDDVLFVSIDRARERYTTRKRLKDYTRLLEEGLDRTTRELLETFAFQQNLIESSMDGILGVDEKDRVVTFNQSIEKTLGYDKGEVVHKADLDRFFPPGAAEKLRSALKDDGYGGKNSLFLYETNLIDRSGNGVPVQISATALFEENREAGKVLFIRDLRQLRRLEREMADQARILHQDKMMSLGRLAASVVHEINNPLAGILNYLRLMIRSLERGPLAPADQEKFRSYLDLVESETERCSRIISSLLTFSRKTPPSRTEVRIRDLVERSMILSQHKLELSHIRLDVQIPPDLPAITGDINQLQQCLINLIFNAIDAMPDGGTLQISASHDPLEKTVTVSVADTGTGISRDDLPNIFEPFFTTKKEGYGVGLGLSTVYGIMQEHGGRVEVDSRPGHGACFRLEFPV